MQTDIHIDPAATRILRFEEVYPARAAQEQAEKRKLDAFGTLARLNPLNRPKADTVALSKWELRYEPFPRTPTMRVRKRELIAADTDPAGSAWDREAAAAGTRKDGR